MPTPTNVLVMKRGDTKPSFRAQCLDGTTGVDVTSSSAIRLLIGGLAPKALALTKEAGTAGWVGRTWASGDLPDEGAYRIEVEVTWSDGQVQTFPANGYAILIVNADLG